MEETPAYTPHKEISVFSELLKLLCIPAPGARDSLTFKELTKEEVGHDRAGAAGATRTRERRDKARKTKSGPHEAKK